MDNSTGILFIALLGLACFVILIWLVIITFKVRRINLREKTVAKAGESGDFITTIENSLKELNEMRDRVDGLHVRHEELALKLQGAVQRVGIVRFDAFEDIGGMLSFAVALLDNDGDGVLVSTINGREESRSYAKPVTKGRSTHNLSIEERQAIEEALLMPSINRDDYSRAKSKA